jgi:hypothetical protein
VNRQHIYTVLVVFVTMLAFSIGNVIYTNRVDAAADRRNQQRARDFCGVIVLIDDRNRQVPPKLPPKATAEQTEQYDVQVKFVAAIHAYRIKLGC